LLYISAVGLSPPNPAGISFVLHVELGARSNDPDEGSSCNAASAGGSRRGQGGSHSTERIVELYFSRWVWDAGNFLSSRSGRIRQSANAEGEDIVLLPIIIEDNDGVWPDCGPPLEKLLQYTQVFFDRNVRVLPAASISSSTLASKKRKRKGNKDNAEFKLRFPHNTHSAGSGHPLATSVTIEGRANQKHTQLQVTSVLDALSAFRDQRNRSKEFCIMAITMEDLFDGPTDLFCTGMAFGGNKVAVFSFFRYHPHLKMHPGTWHDFGYARTPSSYSY